MNESESKAYVTQAVAEHEGPLLRYAGSLCRNTEMAQDAVQDTFLKLWKELDRGGPRNLGPWLFRVCRNRIFEMMRKEHRMSDMENIVPVDEKEPSPEQVLVDKEKRSAVVEWVSELPPREQELIRLKLQNGMSYKEISKVTGLSVSNVGFILHTAMTSLRQRAAAMAGN